MNSMFYWMEYHKNTALVSTQFYLIKRKSFKFNVTQRNHSTLYNVALSGIPVITILLSWIFVNSMLYWVKSKWIQCFWMGYHWIIALDSTPFSVIKRKSSKFNVTQRNPSIYNVVLIGIPQSLQCYWVESLWIQCCIEWNPNEFNAIEWNTTELFHWIQLRSV